MIAKINYLLKLSRYRFWLYLGGTYLTGFIIGANSLTNFTTGKFLLHLIYFMIPANILLYGINDLFDQDTDIFNHKKEDKEVKINSSRDVFYLKSLLILCYFISTFLLLSYDNLNEIILFLSFIILSTIYSLPPLRLKARPIFDFSSNILYFIPGILGYYQNTGIMPPILTWIGLYCFTSAMHFSLIFSFYYRFLFPLSILLLIYPLIPLYILTTKKENIDQIYWYFPYINGIVGFIISITMGYPYLIELIDLIF
ncbi:MAG: prenyltransferase [Candidatus Heimdallarchaeota archaeon]